MSSTVLTDLRERIRRLERGRSADRGVLPFGLADLDERIPGGGLAYGALHEIAGGGEDVVFGAVPIAFAAGIAARTSGQVLWCLTQADLFAPSLAEVGLPPDRVLFYEVGDEKSVLACCEDSLRFGGLGAVVAQVSNLSMTASRRLQLAAESTGSLAIAVRRWRRPSEAAVFGQATAATTRWRVSAERSAPLPVAGIGRERWQVELVHCRSGRNADVVVEACDEAGHLAVLSDVANRSVGIEGEQQRRLA